MKRYKFSLQSALRARRAQEDIARQRLATSNHRLQAAEAVYRQTLDEYRGAGVLAGIVAHEVFLDDTARRDRSAQAVERARQVVKVEAAMYFSAWVDSAKRVRSLDRLDERRRAEWRLEDLRDEAATIDDVVASRWTVKAVGDAKDLL